MSRTRASQAYERFSNELGRHKKMDAETERAELELFAAGDKEAGKRVVVGNLRYALHMARCYARKDQSKYEEYAAAACEGMCRALAVFQPEMGARFWSLAKFHVRTRIQRHIALTRRIVCTPKNGPTHEAVRVARITRPSSPEELAELSGITAEQAHTAWSIATLSDAYVGEYDALCSDGSPAAPGCPEQADSAMYTTMDPVGDMERAQMARDIGLVVMRLNQREQAIARHRLMSDSPKTLAEIADMYGLSRERIRQIEIAVKEKLRRSLRAYKEAA